MTVLIPAYEPDVRLIHLIEQIQNKCSFSIVVVNDGSGSGYNTIFDQAEQMGCTVLRHYMNKGKGRALKTGFEFIMLKTEEAEGVVTADADGQHIVDDIIRVAGEIPKDGKKIVLGARKFIGKVPLRSAIGNKFTRTVFSLASGKKLYDTQTGLRGFPVTLLPWLLTLEGERFEYEMNMLLRAGAAGFEFKQIFINTIYITGNSSSHFRVVSDSIRVFIPFFKFCLSSITAAFVDYTLLFVMNWLTGNLVLSIISARVASSAVNFTVNRTIVFKYHTYYHKTGAQILNYYILVCILLAMNICIMSFLTQVLMVNLIVSKVFTEMFLFIISYTVQHHVVFKKPVQYN